jgi:hypothetical protein
MSSLHIIKEAAQKAASINTEIYSKTTKFLGVASNN